MDKRRTGGRVLEWDTVALQDGRQADERRMGGGRVLDWDTAALLDGRLLDKRTLAVLSVYNGVARLTGDRWMSAR